MLRDTLSDADNEGNLGLNGLFDTSCRHGRAMKRYTLADHDVLSDAILGSVCSNLWICGYLRNKDGRGRGASLLDGIRDVCENREAQMCGASLLGVCSANNLGTCWNA